MRIPELGLDARASPDSGASFLSRRFADAWSAVDLEAELADDALPRAARRVSRAASAFHNHVVLYR